MKTQTLSLSALLLAVLTSCNWFNTSTEVKDIVLDEKSAQMVDSTNAFGFNLFDEIVSKENEEKNIMISPLSISQALYMTLNGAAGNTFDQMSQVLNNEVLSLSDINASNLGLYNALTSHDKKVNLQIVNSIWHRNDVQPKSLFLNNNQTYYHATIKSYDPAQPEKAKDSMNKWVKDNTKGKIDKLINEVSAQDVMFLLNAVYFKGEWKSQFKKSNTVNKPFTLDNGTETEALTMIGEVDLYYYNDTKFSVIKLPYGSGKFNMLIILPEEGYTTTDIAGQLKDINFDLLKSQNLVKRDIWLPKFEFSYEIKLNSSLHQLGMTDAFNSGLANFNNMVENSNLFISKVIHKTYIKTDEEGSEAAAATAVTMSFTSVGPVGPIKIDRSFLFAIVEDDTNAILFAGKLFNPNNKGE